MVPDPPSHVHEAAPARALEDVTLVASRRPEARMSWKSHPRHRIDRAVHGDKLEISPVIALEPGCCRRVWPMSSSHRRASPRVARGAGIPTGVPRTRSFSVAAPFRPSAVVLRAVTKNADTVSSPVPSAGAVAPTLPPGGLLERGVWIRDSSARPNPKSRCPPPRPTSQPRQPPVVSRARSQDASARRPNRPGEALLCPLRHTRGLDRGRSSILGPGERPGRKSGTPSPRGAERDRDGSCNRVGPSSCKTSSPRCRVSSRRRSRRKGSSFRSRDRFATNPSQTSSRASGLVVMGVR
jgi:hypothetical protein